MHRYHVVALHFLTPHSTLHNKNALPTITLKFSLLGLDDWSSNGKRGGGNSGEDVVVLGVEVGVHAMGIGHRGSVSVSLLSVSGKCLRSVEMLAVSVSTIEGRVCAVGIVVVGHWVAVGEGGHGGDGHLALLGSGKIGHELRLGGGDILGIIKVGGGRGLTHLGGGKVSHELIFGSSNILGIIKVGSGRGQSGVLALFCGRKRGVEGSLGGLYLCGVLDGGGGSQDAGEDLKTNTVL
jgi:hypothetical protein